MPETKAGQVYAVKHHHESLYGLASTQSTRQHMLYLAWLTCGTEVLKHQVMMLEDAQHGMGTAPH